MSKQFSLEFRHFGIFVVDVVAMKKFYTGVLGYFVTDEGDFPNGQRLVFMSREPSEHHQVILVSGRPDTQGFNLVNQLSFYVDSLEELQSFYQLIVELEVEDIQPVTHGNAWSVYFRDPEGNRIEVYTHTPWYVNQPLRQQIDFNREPAAIEQETEALCRDLPGFCSRQTWLDSMQSLMNTGTKQ